MTGVWAVVPVKEQGGAKQRLSDFLPPEQRRALAAAKLKLPPPVHPEPPHTAS